MLIERQIQRQIEAALFKGKTLVLFGPRQVGKTTLVKTILEAHPGKSSYVSCDLPEVQKLLREPKLEDLRRFVAHCRLLVLDEAGRSPVVIRPILRHWPGVPHWTTLS